MRVGVLPDGAFYLYARSSHFAQDSSAFRERILREAKVCIVLGKDFGHHDTQRHVRLSYATALPRIHEAVQRTARLLRTA